MPAQGKNSAARSPHVAQERLQDRGGADVLHTDGVLGPAEAVDERGRAVPAGVVGDKLAHPSELVLTDPADLLHHFRGIAREMPLEHLEHAARMLQRLVGVWSGMGGSAARTM